MYRIRMDAADRGKLPAKPPGVERGAGADHVDRASRPAPREVLRKNIERTRRHETDSRKSPHFDMPRALFADSEIGACQVEARLTGSGMTTECHNEHILGFDGRQGSPANLARLEHGQSMTEIKSLTLGVTLGSVINRQSRDESVTDDGSRTRRPNAARADNPNSRHDRRTIQTHRRSHSTDRSARLCDRGRQADPTLSKPSHLGLRSRKIGAVEQQTSQT